jgi:hypothetical protein
MEQALEERQRFPVREDDSGDVVPVGTAAGAEYLLAEALDQRPLHVVVRGEQMVDDLVAGDGRRAVASEGAQRLALPGADSAGDRDRERPHRG